MGVRIARCLLVAVAATAAGCGHAAAPVRPAATPASTGGKAASGNQIVVDQALTGGAPDRLGAWIVYGLARAGAAKDGDAHLGDYAAEVQARSVLADTWKEKRAAGLHDPYLDLLVEVREAGFIAEYALAFLARPGWIVPGAELAKLDFAGFERWIPAHLPKQHHPETRVAVVASGREAPVPGEGLPASEEIDPRRAPCASLMPKVAVAMGRWDEEEARLGHVAVGVLSDEQLLPTFAWATRDPRARREGVVVASPRAVETLFVAGFCALDGGAAPTAERLLRRAVALSPGNGNMRSELVQTLIIQKKLDEADAQLNAAFEVAGSPCHVAVLWRKRGYILFDRGKLVDSYHAYARSLEYDPGNDIATKEMQLILSQLRSAGGFDEKALKGFSPPPPGKMRVTNCR